MIEVLLSISMLAESKKKEGGIGQFMIMNGSASFIQKDSLVNSFQIVIYFEIVY